MKCAQPGWRLVRLCPVLVRRATITCAQSETREALWGSLR
eukprot:CAMPEP_0195148720 /NCGR_PEP_ID=MMETSP0448-20130528/175763_1 /TAXON_ID=66468 /ORGANISM="Heterocapsa triquestra, Strain CCMP 448" /LENGTH=39 /DNA_ID= /DNA_START= /DNA_END= /DNA_ORIENTATION=